jgi:hypothetical protein
MEGGSPGTQQEVVCYSETLRTVLTQLHYCLCLLIVVNSRQMQQQINKVSRLHE